MTPRDFCYWLQGFFEITGNNDVNGDYVMLDSYQVEKVKKQLDLVFTHEIEKPPAYYNSVIMTDKPNKNYDIFPTTATLTDGSTPLNPNYTFEHTLEDNYPQCVYPKDVPPPSLS
jgi:hypothetical protein